MQCVMQCMIVHEWNVRSFFFWILFFFFIFPHFTNAKCKYHSMGMLWCRYARHDTNAPLWVCHGYKCLLESMPWYECLLGSMPWCECPLVGMQWMRIPACGYIMIRMLWCKHKLFKNSLYFQNEVSSAPKIKIFSKLDLLFLKSHPYFLT